MADRRSAVQNALEIKDEPVGEVSEYTPLRKLAEHVMIIGRCCDCNTERTFTVGQIKASTGPLATVHTLAKTEKCRRMGCGADMDFRIALED